MVGEAEGETAAFSECLEGSEVSDFSDREVSLRNLRDLKSGMESERSDRIPVGKGVVGLLEGLLVGAGEGFTDGDCVGLMDGVDVGDDDGLGVG